MERSRWIWHISRSQGCCRGDRAEYPQEPGGREAKEEIRVAKPRLKQGQEGRVAWCWESPGTRQEISCSLRASTAWVSSGYSTQLPVTSARVHKHRREVGMAEPVLFRLPTILHCKLCLQLAINLPKI